MATNLQSGIFCLPMSVDKLRQQTKEFSREPIIEIEGFLFSVRDKIKGLELNEKEKRNLSFVYHRCWSFKDRLIKKYFPDGDSFTQQEAHLYPEHRLSAEQEVKALLKSNSEYRDSVLIPEVLRQDSENVIRFLEKKSVAAEDNDHILHLEKNGYFWYFNRDEKCYKMGVKGKRYKLLKYLAEQNDYCVTSTIKDEIGFSSDKITSNEIKAVRQKIESILGFDDVIINEPGIGYRINPKYKIN